MIAPHIQDGRVGPHGAILDRLLKLLQRGSQTKLALEYGLWGYNAPPARNNLSHHIWRLNQVLKPMGYRVTCRVTRALADRGRSPGRAGERTAMYRIVSIPPTLATKPAHKVFDPEGVYVGS